VKTPKTSETDRNGKTSGVQLTEWTFILFVTSLSTTYPTGRIHPSCLGLVLRSLPHHWSYPSLSTVPNGAKWEDLDAEDTEDPMVVSWVVEVRTLVLP